MSEFLRTRAEINLDALKNNFRIIKEKAGSSKVIAVVKANAYGHGAAEVCRVLKNEGADMFAVSSLDEAEEIRQTDKTTPILILGYTDEKAAEKLSENDIIQAVYSKEYAQKLNKEAEKAGVKVKGHIAFDCGMGRIGFSCDENGINEAYFSSMLENLDIKGVFTHFPSADKDNDESGEITKKQYEKFAFSVAELENRGIKFEMRHCGNSAVILSKPYAKFDAVRAGIILYGLAPSKKVKNDCGLLPVMKIITKVAHIKQINAGDTVGYGMAFKADRKMTVATVCIGYADGYIRAFAKKGKFLINGRYAGIIGRICMDQLMLDITGLGEVKCGDDAVCMGESENSADILADAAGTINYEIVCLIGHRVPRVYTENGKTVKTENYLRK